MAVAAVVIYNGWAESLQTKVPSYASWLQNRIEGNGQAKNQLAQLSGIKQQPSQKYPEAPAIQGITAWINSVKSNSANS